MQVASIGPVTSATARDRGLKVAIHAGQSAPNTLDAEDYEKRGWLGPNLLICHYIPASDSDAAAIARGTARETCGWDAAALISTALDTLRGDVSDRRAVRDGLRARERVLRRGGVGGHRGLDVREARGADVAGTQVHSVRLPSFVVSTEVVFALPDERLVMPASRGRYS